MPSSRRRKYVFRRASFPLRSCRKTLGKANAEFAGCATQRNAERTEQLQSLRFYCAFLRLRSLHILRPPVTRANGERSTNRDEARRRTDVAHSIHARDPHVERNSRTARGDDCTAITAGEDFCRPSR